MNNLFSVFDPVALLRLPLNWRSSLVVLAGLPPLFWLGRSQAALSVIRVLSWAHAEFSAILGVKVNPGATLVTLSLFIFIGLNNFFGLSPYTFTASRHLTFTAALALPMWLGIIVYAIISQPWRVLAHLVPLGTPYPLIPFMVLIELTRRVIRPLTLSVRLAANMVAGHLLLTLIRSPASGLNWPMAALLMAGVVLLGVLESAVAVIQAYVFGTLITLYLQEVDGH
jgi:F-type H+-transporting ATPase subunit a